MVFPANRFLKKQCPILYFLTLFSDLTSFETIFATGAVSIKAVFNLANFYLMLTRFESNAGLTPTVQDKVKNEWCKILTKMQLLEYKCSAIDLIFRFSINLNTPYFDAERVKTLKWESPQAVENTIKSKVWNANSCFDTHSRLVFWMILTNMTGVSVIGTGVFCCCSGCMMSLFELCLLGLKVFLHASFSL